METLRHRVGFIGAGHISRFHAEAVMRLRNADLVGVYDVDPGRCEALARLYGARAMPSIDAFVDEHVDVLHVLTPPETHADVCLQAMELGAHVLVEKPLATDMEACRRIAAAAREAGLRVCVDHSLLYDVHVRQALDKVKSGSIGRVVSVEILRSADYPPYEGGPLPPQYRSAGYPFRDLGIHQLYLLAAFLGPIENVHAEWDSLGGDPNLTFDEWRADVRCRDGYGHVHISYNVRPIQNVIIVSGTTGVMRIEPMSMLSVRRRAMPLPKAAERVINAYTESLQTLVEVPVGIVNFVRKNVRQYDGVQRLIAEFYRTLDEGLPVPVGVEDAAPIVGWVERVARAAEADAATRASTIPALSASVPVLVTGAAGGLGSAVVERLRRDGQRLRIFVRRYAAPVPDGLEIATGDLGNPEAVDAAVRGARTVVHIGAAMKGGWITHRASTVVGTRNVIEACLKNGVEQLIYISSLSVVQWSGTRQDATMSESSPLEESPHERGAYTRAKLEAELLVREAVERRGLHAVILRPGQIFGGRLPLLNAAVARKAGRFRIVLGDGELQLPLVYLDDVVDAICLAMDKRLCNGEIVQLVDRDLPTQNEILRSMSPPGTRIIRIPAWAVFAGGWLSEIACKPLKRASPLSRYRLRSALARRRFVSENAQRILQWSPRVGVRRGIEAASRANGSS